MTNQNKLRPPSEICYWWIAETVPSGEAPIDIQQQWLDVPLPLRYERSAEIAGPDEASRRSVFLRDNVMVMTLDAIKALRVFDREPAASF